MTDDELNTIEEANRPPHGPADRTVGTLVAEVRRLRAEVTAAREANEPYRKDLNAVLAREIALKAQLATARAEATDAAALVAQKHALKWLDMANERAAGLTPEMSPDHPWRRDVHQHRAMASVAHDIAGELLATAPAEKDYGPSPFEAVLPAQLAAKPTPDAKPPGSELSKQVEDALRMGRLEVAANEEYRHGRYKNRADGGPALAALNAERKRQREAAKPTPDAKCGACKGSGKVFHRIGKYDRGIETDPTKSFQRPCDHCGGTGVRR